MNDKSIVVRALQVFIILKKKMQCLEWSSSLNQRHMSQQYRSRGSEHAQSYPQAHTKSTHQPQHFHQKWTLHHISVEWEWKPTTIAKIPCTTNRKKGWVSTLFFFFKKKKELMTKILFVRILLKKKRKKIRIKL